MVVYLCLRWWYSAGWHWVLQSVLIDRSVWVMETFSTGDLARTLFAPFRQTYAGQIKGPLGVQIRAFFDRLISRVIGFIVRMVLISMSLVAMLVVLLTAIIGLVVWPLIPLLPLLSFLFMGMRLGA
jgi:hypothetical protein